MKVLLKVFYEPTLHAISQPLFVFTFILYFNDITMESQVLTCNNTLSFSLKTTLVNVDDLASNFLSLKQLQLNINQLQDMKDDVQLQMNTISLALLRRYILSDKTVGVALFRNLIRKYYPLNDNMIMKYENILSPSNNPSFFYITNYNVLKRKGVGFFLNDRCYNAIYKYPNNVIYRYHNDLLMCIPCITDITYPYSQIRLRDEDIYSFNQTTDFHGDNNILDTASSRCGKYRNALMENEFTQWDWELVKDINRGIDSTLSYDWGLKTLLNNRGFIAQMGIGNVRETIVKLQEIANGVIPQCVIDDAIAKYQNEMYLLYSYIPLSKEFIINHRDELCWDVLQYNPLIHWDLELINLFLMKYKENKNEIELVKGLSGSLAMYQAIAPILNDDILSDIEKLYDL